MVERWKSLKLGVIGCGRVAEFLHLPVLSNLPEAQVIAVADIDPHRLHRVADRFGITQRHTNYLALLDHPAIEAIAVCVPAQFHAEVGVTALKAGKHLLIEKPLALSLDDGALLRQQATLSPRKVMVGFNLRWHRLVRQARAVLQQGTLGPIELIRTVLTSHPESVPEWRRRRESGGGVLFEQAVHHVDLWRFLLHSDAEEVFVTTRSGRWEDETATVNARLANGALATSVFSERTSANNEIEIYGRAGRVRVSCYRFDGLECFSRTHLPSQLQTRLRKIAHILKELPRAALQMRHGGDFLASYRAEWRHFIAAIQRDTPVECTVEDGWQALQVVLAALESASRGRPVKVSEAPWRITPLATGGTAGDVSTCGATQREKSGRR